MMRNGRPILVVFGLMVVTALLYAQTATFDFTTYDDPLYVTANEHVLRGWTAAGWKWAWTTGYATNWHPLTWISHMLDAEVFGSGAAGPHVVNVLFHVGSVALLFGLLFRQTGYLWRSALVTALFALHPLRVESVAWVSERKDVLSAFWTLATVFLYAEYARSTGRTRSFTSGTLRPQVDAAARSLPWKTSAWSAGFYAGAVACAALAMLSKPMAVTIPFLLLLVDGWPLARIGDAPFRQSRRPSGREGKRPEGDKNRSNKWPAPLRVLVLEKVPFVMLAITCAAATWAVQYQGGAMQAGVTIPFGDRLINAIVAPAWYVWKLAVPVDLSPLYIHPNLPGGVRWTAWQIAASVVFSSAVSFLVFLGRAQRHRIVGWLWFLGMLIPVIGLVQVGGQAAADRYTYLPSIGILLLVVWEIAERVERSRVRSTEKYRGTAVVAATAVLVSASAFVLSWKQLQVWRDSESLYRHALKLNPDNMLMHNNLALVLYEQGRAEEAESHFREAIRVLPTYRQAMEGLASILAERGANADAIDLLQTASRLRPGRASGSGPDQDRARILRTLGALLLAEGRTEEAHRVLADVGADRPEVTPDQPQPASNQTAASVANERGQQLEGEGQRDAARAAYESALAIDPQHAEAAYNLGNILAQQGALHEAVTLYKTSLQRRPEFALARNNLGWALLQLGKASEAQPHLEEALRLQPGWDLPSRSLAWILATDPDPNRRDPARALSLAQDALRSAKQKTAVYYETLGAAYAAQGDFPKALEAIAQATQGATAGSALAARLQEQSALYRRGQPYLVE